MTTVVLLRIDDETLVQLADLIRSHGLQRHQPIARAFDTIAEAVIENPAWIVDALTGDSKPKTL